MPAQQSFKNHAHQPVLTFVATTFLAIAIVGFDLRWNHVGGRWAMPLGLGGVMGAIMVLIMISRSYTTKLQDRIIRLEMRVRGMQLLTPEQQRLLAGLSIKQVAALRFASDAELPALLERASREQLPPKEIKRAVKTWIPDDART